MTEQIDLLASYLPPLVIRRFLENPAPQTEPSSARFSAAVLFADISGFTALTEELSQRGEDGLEELTGLLNDYFSRLVEIICAHGGEVVKFAGDAMLAFWPSTPETLTEAALRAARCALDAQSALTDFAIGDGRKLSLRIGLSAGDIFSTQVGGVFKRWEFLVAGEPLVDVSIAEKQAAPGQVVVSPWMWGRIMAQCKAAMLESGGMRLLAVDAPLPPQPFQPLRVPPEIYDALKSYVPAAIQSRLVAGQTGWLAESRRLTVLFINLPDLTYRMELARAQQVMRALQESIYYYEGSINKLSVDDKGATLVAALGLPPLAHEDDPARGVLAALSAQAALKKIGIRCSIGVTTGRAFCGSIGTEIRREYTMIGAVVNLAARLMTHALDDIFCDQATWQAAQGEVEFLSLPPVQVKGRSDAVVLFRPLGKKKESVSTPRAEMVGRDSERCILLESLADLRAGRAGVALIEGEAGIGKSRLLAELLAQADDDLVVLSGAGDAVEKSTPYHAWRPIFSRIFDIDTIIHDDPRAHVAAEASHLADLPDVQAKLPLLNAVLSLDFPETSLTREMFGQVRAENTRELLLAVLQAQAARRHLVLVLEDAHWLDSASWALAQAVLSRVRPLLLVIATRPIPSPPPLEYTSLLRLPDLRHIRLQALPPEAIEQLICLRLRVRRLPEQVASLLREKAEGHPFFSEELAYALRDSGLIQILDGECLVAPGIDLRAVALPDTVQGVITSRIDRLTPQQQLALKIASVIGRVFAFRVLSDIYPIEADKPYLLEYLAALESLDLTPLDSPEPDLSYIFKHIITQDVAYNMMLFSQRRRLHRAVAEWYERTYADDLAPYYPVLAHHWSMADERDRAINYLEKAGGQALENYANHEAILFLEEALRLADAKQPAARRAFWSLQLGSAYLWMGDLPRANQHLRESLALRGHPFPQGNTAMVLSLLRALARQLRHTFFPGLYVVGDGSRQAITGERARAMMEMVRAYESIGEIGFFSNETLTLLYAFIEQANLSELVAPSAERARAYGGLCVAVSLVPLIGLAQVYARRASDLAARLGSVEVQARVPTIVNVFQIAQGQWQNVLAAMPATVAAAERLGHWRYWGDALVLQADALLFQGRYAEAQALFDRLHQQSTRRGDPQQQIWALEGFSQIALPQGRLADAIHTLETANKIIAAIGDSSSPLITYGILAQARALRGESDQALRDAQVSLAVMEAAPSTLFSVYIGFSTTTETFLELWDADPTSPARDFARRACKAYAAYARVLPIGRPGELRARAWQLFLEGKPTEAFAAWQKGIEAARAFSMPYEQARTHFELGRHLPKSDPARAGHLQTALELFQRLGAEGYAEQSRTLMAS